MSWIGTIQSGSPFNVTAACGLFANCVPDQVGVFPFDKVGASWADGAYRGNYFADALTIVTDPQVNNVTTLDSLRTYATGLYAVKDSAGNTILQNPLPGMRGNFGQNRLYGPGSWNLDMALSKMVRFSESKSAQIRVDVTNIFNHPQPSGAYNTAGSRIIFASNPIANITSNSNYFGEIPYKVGVRTFQARLRFSF
jgi:hypothetical protein